MTVSFNDGVPEVGVAEFRASRTPLELDKRWTCSGNSVRIGPVNQLEEGMQADLDFGKLAKVAATGTPVIPVVLQDADTLDVLFVGYANADAVEASLAERIAVLWSTSRNELWRKGATSGDVLELVEIRVNCEQNSLLYLVRRTTGGACHTLLPSGAARPSCYYRTLSDAGTLRPVSASLSV
jgi:phosphoribosyl-AMP cyclohydrolase